MYTAELQGSSVPRYTSNHAKLLSTALQSMMYNTQPLSLSLFVLLADSPIFCCESADNPLQSRRTLGLATITSSQGGV